MKCTIELWGSPISSAWNVTQALGWSQVHLAKRRDLPALFGFEVELGMGLDLCGKTNRTQDYHLGMVIPAISDDTGILFEGVSTVIPYFRKSIFRSSSCFDLNRSC
jgi:hypothetical protein